MVYDIPETRLQAHRIKPALFDLFLGLAIVAYGFLWYVSVLVSCFMCSCWVAINEKRVVKMCVYKYDRDDS